MFVPFLDNRGYIASILFLAAMTQVIFSNDSIAYHFQHFVVFMSGFVMVGFPSGETKPILDQIAIGGGRARVVKSWKATIDR